MFRKMVMVVVAAALVGAIIAPAAMALNETCAATPCKGTNHKDRLFERKGNGVNDNIYGLGGKDTIRASRYGHDRDRVYGGSGNDVLRTDDGDSKDKIDGGPGFNVCFVDAGDRAKNCDVEGGF